MRSGARPWRVAASLVLGGLAASGCKEATAPTETVSAGQIANIAAGLAPAQLEITVDGTTRTYNARVHAISITGKAPDGSTFTHNGATLLAWVGDADARPTGEVLQIVAPLGTSDVLGPMAVFPGGPPGARRAPGGGMGGPGPNGGPGGPVRPGGPGGPPPLPNGLNMAMVTLGDPELRSFYIGTGGSVTIEELSTGEACPPPPEDASGRRPPHPPGTCVAATYRVSINASLAKLDPRARALDATATRAVAAAAQTAAGAKMTVNCDDRCPGPRPGPRPGGHP